MDFFHNLAANLAPNSNVLPLSNGIEFVHVPAGKFLMGSNNYDDDEKPLHSVDIFYDYWMARYPVTNELYNSYTNAKGIRHPKDGWERKKKHPIVPVSWEDSMKYCQWLNNLLYEELPSGLILRLPTEAEWEKAARGINGREYPWGNQFDKNKCNSSEGGKGSTTPVGLYSPHGDSPYGCADMIGNVWEWTLSLKKEYPYKVDNGCKEEKSSNNRVHRGGSFVCNERKASCTYRCNFEITDIHYRVGFRVVLAPSLQSNSSTEGANFTF